MEKLWAGGKELKGTVYVEVQGLGNEEMLLVQL